MSYEKPQNDTETLSADEQKLRAMCLSLTKAEAPKDFDFKLKARIASAKPSDFQPRFGWALRYALPALALILVLGLLAYNGGFLSPKDNQFVAESSVVPQNPELPQNSPPARFAPPEINKQTDNNAAAVANPDSQKQPEKTQPQVAGIQNSKNDLRKDKKDSSVRSKVFSLTQDNTNQPDFNTNSFMPKLPNADIQNQIPVNDVLSINGIRANFENGKWKVKSVTANSVGESSGVRENDIIEAIDNQPLSGETINGKNFSGKTITVTRNGKKSQIELRNKQ